MNRLIASLKKIRLSQVFTALLAGVFLLVGSVFTSADVLAKTAEQVREEVPSGMVTSELKGGMNDYSDIDPRDRNASAAEAKAESLIRKAEERINDKSSSNVPENIRRVAEEGPKKLDKISQKLDKNGRKAQQAAKEFGDNTKEGIANIKDNASDGLKGAKDIAKEAGTKAKNKAQTDANTLKKSLSQATDNVKGAAKQAK